MRYWLINAICGLIVLILLGMHMTSMHLNDLLALVIGGDAEPLSWSQVSLRGQSQLYTMTYIVLLGTALFHGLYGLHTVLTEVWSGRRAEKLILFVCWAAGLLLFGFGAVAAVAFYVLQSTA